MEVKMNSFIGWLVIIIATACLVFYTLDKSENIDLKTEKELLQKEKERIEQEKARLEREREREKKKKFEAKMRALKEEIKSYQKETKKIESDIKKMSKVKPKKVEPKIVEPVVQVKPTVQVEPDYTESFKSEAKDAINKILLINQDLFLINDEIQNCEQLFSICNRSEVEDTMLENLKSKLKSLKDKKETLVNQRNLHLRALKGCNDYLTKKGVKKVEITYPETNKVVVLKDDTIVYAKSISMSNTKVVIVSNSGEKYEKHRADVVRVIVPDKLDKNKLFDDIIATLKTKYDPYFKKYELYKESIIANKRSIKSSCWFWRTVVGPNGTTRRVRAFDGYKYKRLCRNLVNNARFELDKDFKPYENAKEGILKTLKKMDYKLMTKIAVYCSTHMNKRH